MGAVRGMHWNRHGMADDVKLTQQACKVAVSSEQSFQTNTTNLANIHVCCRYLHWVSCPNELPPTMSAYKTQQYRWNSGPMVVIKSLVRRIWTTDMVGFWDRLSCTYFFLRSGCLHSCCCSTWT